MNGNALIQTAFAQAIQVSAVIVVVLMVSWWLRQHRPHLVAALWLVVLSDSTYWLRLSCTLGANDRDPWSHNQITDALTLSRK